MAKMLTVKLHLMDKIYVNCANLFCIVKLGPLAGLFILYFLLFNTDLLQLIMNKIFL